MKNPEFAARAFPLLIELSQDGAEWRTLYRNEARKPFGGVDGRPLALHCGWDARYVRLSLLTRDFFHLDQVEIYGD